MTDTTLAQLSNTAIYSAMVVLTLAMLAHAVSERRRYYPARHANSQARCGARAACIEAHGGIA